MKHSRSSLFLMEMIIAILFFSLASAVCIQLFAKSHTLSKQTVNQNYAVIHAQNLAESYLALEGDLEQIAPLFESASFDASNNTIQLYFDAEWNPTNAAGAFFQAGLTGYPLNEAGLITADITVSEVNTDSDALFSLQVSHHIAERRSTYEQ